jgi:hypothetical protein
MVLSGVKLPCGHCSLGAGMNTVLYCELLLSFYFAVKRKPSYDDS